MSAFRFLAIWFLVVGAIFTMGGAVCAFDAEQHFRGKTIKLLIPTGPGGGRSLYALPFASAYGRNLPGAPVVTPVFMPGAGGSIALNNAYSLAASDGLTIVTPLVSVLNAQIIGEKSVQYDARRFRWIGRTQDAARVLVVAGIVRARTLEDLQQQEIVVGAVGQASDTATNATFMNALFKTRFKVIAGYGASNKAMLAIAGGETQGAFTTWDNVKTNHRADWQDGVLRPVLQIGFTRQPELPDVPLVLDLARTETERHLVRLMSTSTLMGQSIAAPPGVPDDILGVLRRGFDATMQDADFRERMKAIGGDVNAMTGEELTDLVNQIMATPPDVVELYKKLG
jgi:hypothetical protein